MRDKLMIGFGIAMLTLGILYLKNRIFLDRFRKASEQRLADDDAAPSAEV